VVVTTGMIGDLVRRIAGDTVRLEQLMGPGVDPHLFEPKQSDNRKLSEADLVLYNGLHLEGKMVHYFEKNTKARAVARDIPQSLLIQDGDQPDPHVWFDVSLWIKALDRLAGDLAEAFPEHALLYRENAARYRQELEALHVEVKTQLATVPREQRVMVTAHDAFRYFGRAYDIEVHGLQGVSTATEAGLKEVQRLVDLVVSRKIKAIFVESSVPEDGINAVIERAARRGLKLQKAEGTLYSDAMGEPGTPEGTYPGMVRHNVRLIVTALK
jgi:manganese/zinc/iron transport system substrate-binding protein